MTQQGNSDLYASDGEAGITLEARPERMFIRESASHRHVEFRIVVSPPARARAESRTPVNLALVIDRSGSMEGEKLATAKRAALAVVERLDERDHLAIVVFDDRVDIVQPIAPVTAKVKKQVRAALSDVEARAQTALFEGWATGIRAITPGTVSDATLGRCYLLTDGLANVGVTDSESIAAEAAGVRENTGIGTSTFGIGDDYNRFLLGPMASAGGGQFFHLRNGADLIGAFSGQLDELFQVAAQRVSLEVAVDPGITIEVISAYPVTAGSEGASLDLGDLMAGEERHIVVRFGFPKLDDRQRLGVRARAIWREDGRRHESEWQGVTFTYAANAQCDAERRDPTVMHWVGLHHASRAKMAALEMAQNGNTAKARDLLRRVARRIAEYAGSDAELEEALRELHDMQAPGYWERLSPAQGHEHYYISQTRSRGQRDRREG